MSRKPERRGFVGFVGGIQAQNQAQQTFIETKSGLRMNRRAIDAANAERALRDSDARLRDAVRRLDAEKAHSEELARITASRRQKTAVTLRKRKEQSANSLKNNKQTQKDDGNAANSAGGIWIDGTATGLNDECVSLDFNLDELLVSAASPPRQQPQTLPSKFLSSPRGMAALYKTSHSPSLETHCAYENKENSGDGILEFYAFSSANSNTNIIPVVEKPSNWKLEIDEMVTLLDISSHYVDSRLSKKTHLLSDTTTTENIVEADDGAASLKDYNSSSHDAIVIEHKSPLMITAETHDVEIQTAISQPRRITLPNTVLTSIRNGKQKYCRARIIKSSGHSIHESIDAAEIIATEFFDNLLHTVATELDELGYEFIQNLIAAEFVDELNKED
ncbi:hypothetical protein HK100_004775 [Physocladia obscura]|uniref:Uncharacterized protein n=1 Tax=Physocladia obscura TaxID=109957 RepID=A0AAD5X9R1_9FUNG|nr:hypothetical protein HK100_004775 [Physocladia obscura]